MSNYSLDQLGFSESFRDAFSALDRPGALVARVAAEHRGAYVVLTEHGERVAEASGRLRHEAVSRVDLPAVGDWVSLVLGDDLRQPSSPGIVHEVLPRRSAFVRAVAGGVTEPQVVAANVDVVVVVCAANDANARRLDRYLALVRACGAEPVLALTKIDLHPLDSAMLAEIERNAAAAVHPVSSLTGEGVAEISAYFSGQRTLALVGSSGAGKSTLVNRLLGVDKQSTGGLGVDGRGAHTTTHRELIVVPSGGLVIDTPGMRELRLWDADNGLDEAFADLAELAARCRFTDCAHEGEPGCAVRAALDDGTLPIERWRSWDKLQRENAAFAERKDARVAAEARRQRKVFARAARVRDRSRR